MIYAAIERLLSYALTTGLSPAEDLPWLKNRLLSLFGLPGWEEDNDTVGESLPEILQAMTGYAAAQGLLPQDSPTGRDLFDTRIMGEVTPPLPGAGEHRAPSCHRLVLPSLPGLPLHPQRAGSEGHKVENPYPLWGTGHHCQPLEAREGSQGHCRRPQPACHLLPRLRPLSGKRGLRRPARHCGAAESASNPHLIGGGTLVFPVFPLCLLS